MEEYQEQIRQELSEIESKEGWNSRYQVTSHYYSLTLFTLYFLSLLLTYNCTQYCDQSRADNLFLILQKIRMESIYNEYSCTEAKAPCNKLLNRYRDVSPFDHSRVILNKGPCSYINASVVKVRIILVHNSGLHVVVN